MVSEKRRAGKVLEIELMKEERVAWEVQKDGLIVVGPYEGEEEGKKGWGGIDEISLIGLALARLGSGRREEGEEMMR